MHPQDLGICRCCSPRVPGLCIATLSPTSSTELPPAEEELVHGRALELRDLCLKISLNQDEFCAVSVYSFQFFCKQGPCLPQELETWNTHALPLSVTLFYFLC